MCKNQLLRPEKGTVPVVEIHLLFVALGVVRNPQLLGVWLEPDIDKAQGEYESDGQCGNQDNKPIMVVESAYFFKNVFEAHLIFWLNVELIMIK